MRSRLKKNSPRTMMEVIVEATISRKCVIKNMMWASPILRGGGRGSEEEIQLGKTVLTDGGRRRETTKPQDVAEGPGGIQSV